MNDKAIELFIKEIIEVCKKHNLSIGHEDTHGAFIIANYDEYYNEWLLEAQAYLRRNEEG
jgi:hypothetical protein